MTNDNWQNNPYYQIDSYMNWAQREGIPIIDSYSVDCLTAPLEPWSRQGGLGALVHLVGRGDTMNLYLAEIPAGGSLKPERHLYDKVIYVLAGRGATKVEGADG